MKFMKKRGVVPAIIISLLLIIGGVFWWGEEKWKNEHLLEETKVEPASHYQIKRTKEGTIVENKRVGLRVNIPDKWKVEVETLANNKDGLVGIYSPDFAFGPKRIFPKKGCGMAIDVQHRYSEKKFRTVKERINYIKKSGVITNGDKEKEEVISISGYPALKHTYIINGPDIKKELKNTLSIDIVLPKGGTVYHFETIIIPKNQGKCLQEISNILKNVSIK